MATIGHITVRGLRIAYDRAGQGPPLVLLHGIGANASAWRTQLDGLSNAFDVIAWDAPGYGRSDDPPHDWPMAEYADCFAGFLDGLGIAQAHLLGQSWGGVLAQEFYRHHADRVASLILADTTLGGDVTRDDGETRLHARLRALETMTPAEYAHARAPQLLAPDPSPDVLREVETIFAQIHPAGFRSAAIALASADVRAVLPRIRVPTLVLCGEQDQVTSPTIGARLIGEIPNARMIVFPGVGHLNNMEQPDHYNATVRAFLDAIVIA